MTFARRHAIRSLRCAGNVSSGAGLHYPIEVLYKVLSTSIRYNSLVAHKFLTALSITTDDQEYFIRRTDTEPTSARDAACDWVRNNTAKWQAWLAPSEWKYTVCPSVVRDDGTEVTCGFNGGGKCQRLSDDYPDAICVCKPNHKGEACELCADGFQPNPLGDAAAAGFQCIICDVMTDNNTYAIDCGVDRMLVARVGIGTGAGVISSALSFCFTGSIGGTRSTRRRPRWRRRRRCSTYAMRSK